MRRRSFLKAVLSAVAAVYAPASLFASTQPAYDPLDMTGDVALPLAGNARLVELIRQRREQAMTNLAEMMESGFWNKQHVAGLSHWVVKPGDVLQYGGIPELVSQR